MFVPGQIIRRRDLHASFGGQEQGGISTPANHPFIMLFTGESGLSHGYEDGWTETGIFLYSGEGQIGDMSFIRGNRALRDHLEEGKDVYLFEYVEPGIVQYVGQMIVSGHHERKGKDGSGSERNAIVFELIPMRADDPEVGSQNLPEEDDFANLTDRELRQAAEASGTDSNTPDERQASTRRRSRALRQFVLRRSRGQCEGCEKIAPFVTPNGEPYLELHYLKRASDVGPEEPSQVVALCPNCHRRVHVSQDAVSFHQQLAEKARSFATTLRS